jgi:RND superfamily putative drug exporter
MALMPAFMHLLGEWNWWAPQWLARLHRRIGLHHGENTPEPPMTDVTPGRVLEKGRLS